MRPVEILLAEDSKVDAFLVAEALTMHQVSHNLHVVTDGALALLYLHDIGTPDFPCPDLILLDLNLPAVEGPEVLAALRNHPMCRSTPVIIVTSSDAPNDRAGVVTLGISHYFRKPLDIDAFMELGAIVRNVIEASNIH